MKMIKTVSLVAAVVMMFAAAAGAATATSSYAGEAMSIGVGARALGMGGTFAAIADDASTSYWNPAGMTQVQGVEVSSVKLTKINDLETNYSYVNLLYNGNQIGAFGIGWLRQAIKGIQLTAVDALNNPLKVSGLAENADNAFYLAYAYPVMKGFSVGLTGKILIGSYPATLYDGVNPPTETRVSYTGFGADLGLLVNVSAFVKDVNLSIGLNVQDVFTTIGWEAKTGITQGFSETVGLNLKPGLAYKLPIQQFEIVAACDVDTRYDQMVIHAGGEVWWNKMVGLRGGYKSWGEISGQNFTQEPDWSLGASLRWYFIGVDYTYVYNELTPVQYLSIIGKF